MRKLFIIAVFAVVASPAMAQSYNGGYGTGNLVNLPALEHGGFSPGGNAESAFAAATGRELRHNRAVRAPSVSPYDADTVYESGQYVGRDPDPNVRLELRRDWTHE